MNKFDNLYLNLIYEAVPPTSTSTTSCDDSELEDKMVAARTKVFKRFKFFAIMMENHEFVCTNTISTMAVDAFGHIYYNPNFVKTKLSVDELMGVICHECMHNAKNSLYRRGNRDPQLWNIATDLTINWDLIQDEIPLPSIGLIPEKDGTWSLGKKRLAWFKNIKIVVKDRSAEEIYDDLVGSVDERMKKFLDDWAKELDVHVYPPTGEDPEPTDDKDWEPVEGDPVYNEDTGTFGQVIKVNGNNVSIKPISEDEAKQLAILKAAMTM